MTFSDRQAEAARRKKLQQMPPVPAPVTVPSDESQTAPEGKSAASKPAKTAAKPVAPSKKATSEPAKGKAAVKKSSGTKSGKGK